MLHQEEAHTLPLMEHYYTLQGEGHYCGCPAYFIRLAGCDVGCFWCDVKDSWQAEKYPKISIWDMVQEIKKTPAKRVVITGGEPLMYDLSFFTEELKKNNYLIHIETSGAYNLRGFFDWITFSPKKFKPAVKNVVRAASELKIIIYNKKDFEWALKWAEKVPDTCLLFLQPEWSKAEEITPSVISFIKLYPKWRLSLQTHKYLHIP